MQISREFPREKNHLSYADDQAEEHQASMVNQLGISNTNVKDIGRDCANSAVCWHAQEQMAKASGQIILIINQDIYGNGGIFWQGISVLPEEKQFN